MYSEVFVPGILTDVQTRINRFLVFVAAHKACASDSEAFLFFSTLEQDSLLPSQCLFTALSITRSCSACCSNSYVVLKSIASASVRTPLLLPGIMIQFSVRTESLALHIGTGTMQPDLTEQRRRHSSILKMNHIKSID